MLDFGMYDDRILHVLMQHRWRLTYRTNGCALMQYLIAWFPHDSTRRAPKIVHIWNPWIRHPGIPRITWAASRLVRASQRRINVSSPRVTTGNVKLWTCNGSPRQLPPNLLSHIHGLVDRRSNAARLKGIPDKVSEWGRGPEVKTAPLESR
jgi:hypothetical protein